MNLIWVFMQRGFDYDDAVSLAARPEDVDS